MSVADMMLDAYYNNVVVYPSNRPRRGYDVKEEDRNRLPA